MRPLEVKPWMCLSEAVDHVSRVVHSVANARLQLREKLQRAKLTARADRLETDGGGFFAGAERPRNNCDCEIPAAAWQHAEINWEIGSFLRPYLDLSATPGNIGRDLPGYKGSGVRVSRKQVEAFWPASAGELNAECHTLTSAAERGALPAANRPHRPRGTGYGKADAPLIDEMHHLVSTDKVSPTSAARAVVGKALGAGTPESKIDRLVKGYRQRYRD